MQEGHLYDGVSGRSSKPLMWWRQGASQDMTRCMKTGLRETNDSFFSSQWSYRFLFYIFILVCSTPMNPTLEHPWTVCKLRVISISVRFTFWHRGQTPLSSTGAPVTLPDKGCIQLMPTACCCLMLQWIFLAMHRHLLQQLPVSPSLGHHPLWAP